MLAMLVSSWVLEAAEASIHRTGQLGGDLGPNKVRRRPRDTLQGAVSRIWMLRADGVMPDEVSHLTAA